MDDFLAKPIQAASLWEALDRVLRKKEGVGRIEEKETSSLREDLLDSRVLLAACGGDAVILEKLGQAFRGRLPDHVTAVQEALGKRDPVRLRETAHKLCGMVAAFSTVAGEVASEIEDLSAEGRLEEAKPLVGRLATMAQELPRLVGGLSVEALRQQEEASGGRSALG